MSLVYSSLAQIPDGHYVIVVHHGFSTCQNHERILCNSTLKNISNLKKYRAYSGHYCYFSTFELQHVRHTHRGHIYIIQDTDNNRFLTKNGFLTQHDIINVSDIEFELIATPKPHNYILRHNRTEYRPAAFFVPGWAYATIKIVPWKESALSWSIIPIETFVKSAHGCKLLHLQQTNNHLRRNLTACKSIIKKLNHSIYECENEIFFLNLQLSAIPKLFYSFIYYTLGIFICFCTSLSLFSIVLSSIKNKITIS